MMPALCDHFIALHFHRDRARKRQRRQLGPSFLSGLLGISDRRPWTLLFPCQRPWRVRSPLRWEAPSRRMATRAGLVLHSLSRLLLLECLGRVRRFRLLFRPEPLTFLGRLGQSRLPFR